MKKVFNKIMLLCFTVFALFALSSCSNNKKLSDAYGNFEAVETIVSAEASGKLLELKIEEGQEIEQGDVIGYIDTVQMYLKRQQLIAAKKTTATRYKNISSQIDVLQEQKKTALVEKNRAENLLRDNAGTQKQLDDINGNLNIIDKQINSIRTQNSTVSGDMSGLDVQIQQINDQISKSIIINPIRGTVLMKLAENSEIVSFGKPLYKIADLSVIDLRVYVSGVQLPEVKIGQKVKVLIDAGKDSYREMEGTVSWISSKAEFTPKIIQTKEERVNLVYAVKIKVANDGSLKIGMPAEVVFIK